MAALEKRLERAQALRNERVEEHKHQLKTETTLKTKSIPSQQTNVILPSMMDTSHDRKAKHLAKHATSPLKLTTSKRPPTAALGFNIGDKSRIAPKVFKQPSYWDAQGGGFQSKRRGGGKVTEAVGFKLGNKDRVKLRPQWATKMIQGGMDISNIQMGLTADEVTAYLQDEGLMYQLTEAEINKLKHLVELQLLLETDAEVGIIEGSEEILKLMARLAAVGGDLTELHPADQAAILTLIQFSDVVPGFGSAFDEDAIESKIDGANNFVQYTDHEGNSVFIRKGSYVKAQEFENKIEREIIEFDYFEKTCFIILVVIIVIYFILKILALVYGSFLSGNSDGFNQAMMKLEQSSQNDTSIKLNF